MSAECDYQAALIGDDGTDKLIWIKCRREADHTGRHGVMVTWDGAPPRIADVERPEEQ